MVTAPQPGSTTSSADPGGRAPLRSAAFLRAAITVVVLVASTAFGFAQFATQAATPLDAPADQFSASRALVTLNEMSGTGIPRPVGSAENTRVREQLISEIKALGYTPTEQATRLTAQAMFASKVIPVDPPQVVSPFATTNLVNVLVRVPGTDPDHGQAVLVAGHYDTVPSGPGAADDGHAVASMIEVLRAMKNSPPLRHDVIFLMTDGEEGGVRGSRAFVLEHPWAKDVRYVLNFEARGSKGRSTFFEATQMSPDLLDVYGASQPLPQTGSLFYEIYKKLNNNTDFSVFADLGQPGLSFAFLVDLNRYHTPGDTIENLSTGSVQYVGDMMLGLVRNIGNKDSLAAAPEESITWFNIGTILISYPATVSWLVLILGFATWIGALIVGLRRRSVSGGSIVRGVGATLFSVVVTIVIGQLMLALIYLIRPATRSAISLTPATVPDPYQYEWFGSAIAAVAVAATVALFVLIARKQPVAGVALGALALWGVLAVLIQLTVEPGAYTFAIPFLLLSAAVLVRVIWNKPWATLATELIAAAIVLVFILPIVLNTFFAMSLSMIAITCFFLALLVGSLYPVLDSIREIWRWLIPAALGTLGIVLLVIGLATTVVNANNRIPNTLVYSIDGDANSAQWLSYDKAPDEWTQNVLGSDPPREPAPIIMLPFFPLTLADWTVMTSPAKAVLPLTGPKLTVDSDKTVGADRVVEFTTTSTRDALNLSYTMNTSGQLKTINIDGRTLPALPSNSWSVLGYATPKAGYKVTVTLSAGSSLDVVATDMTYGFPQDPALGLPPRPDWSMWGQEPHAFQFDPVMVTKTYKIE